MVESRYRVLPPHPLPEGTPVYRYERLLSGTVGLDSPALEVMTDLRRVKVVTIEASASLEEALNRMIFAGVRMLMVTDAEDAVVGVITSRDLTGEKPVEFATRERVTRDAIRVQHIMTRRDEMEALSMEDVDRARVGDVVETLRAAGRQHAVVVERAEIGSAMVIRGIFSITRIGRQLGVQIEPIGRVQSFAELEAVLNESARLATG